MKFGIRRTASELFAIIASNITSADLSIFHQFEPPPIGGGHQFLRAFMAQAEMRSLRVENNTISRTTRSCLFNSFNFDYRRLLRMKRDSVLFVHRVDGPVDVYRGQDAGVDRSVWQMNQKLADRTIFQSRYSLEKHLELGLQFKEPIVVMNAADSQIFHARERVEFSQNRKIRLIASSWSDNVNKGADVYQWLDEHLDWERFEFTFVGRSPIKFKNINMVSPVDSFRMAELFRAHDIYITASRNDPCSNSLIEALACGMPAIYFQSGGHAEIVNQAGLGFEAAEQTPELLNRLVNQYPFFQKKISLPSIQEVSELYLKTLELV